MKPRSLLPDDLSRLVLTGSELATLGVTERERRGPLWSSGFRGHYVWSGTDAIDPAQRIREAASLLPSGAAIGGWAAAWLLGAHELDGADVTGLSTPRSLVAQPPQVVGPSSQTRGERSQRAGALPVPVCVGPGDPIRPRPGVHLLRSQLVESDITMVAGIPVTSPVRTAYDIGRGAGGRGRGFSSFRRLMNTVADFDAVLRDTATSLASVEDYRQSRPRWRGSPLLRNVLELADPRAASRPESAFRVVWVVAAGLPAPKVNWPVYDDAGVLLGVADVLDEEAGLVGEYDGDYHRRLDRHTRDNAREEGMESHNLVVVRATALDLFHRPVAALVTRVRDGRRRGLGRDRRLDRWLAGSKPLR